MWFYFNTRNHGVDPGTSMPIVQRVIAAAVLLLVICTGTWMINQYASETEAQRKVDLLVQGIALRAQMNRELNRVLYLTSGLSSYIVVRHKNLQRDEIENILAAMHQESKHVKNFAVAVGHRVTYVYPVAGNEKAVGLYYPDVPDQWPAIKRTIASGGPALIGPVDLVQGGQGLIYRVPIFIKGRYWGLLSSVIDSKSLFEGVFADSQTNGLALAIRGKYGQGKQSQVFWGDAAVFDAEDAQLFDVEIPGGQWVLAVRSTAQGGGRITLWLLHGMVWLLALALAWSVLIVLSQRAKLARLALYDALTGLPNRLLIDDRVSRAMSGLRRDSSKACLLLFLDLDRFKLINDQFGHRAGDFTLLSAADRIAATVRQTDTVGRWGGDEFVIFMENIDRSKINELCAKIRLAVEQPTAYDNQELKVEASIGYAVAPDDGSTLDELLLVADQRMYSEKTARNADR